MWVIASCRGDNTEYLINEYESYPTKNVDIEGKIPYTLKCLLLNRYARSCGGSREDTVNGFAKFLGKYYLL